jgi:hypothetical protein
MSMRKSVAALVAATVLSLTAAPAAQAQDCQYAVVTLQNSTNQTLYYQFKWGAEGGWKSYSVPAGYSRYHYLPLDAQGRAPRPYVRFDDGAGGVVEYSLEFYAAWHPSAASGKPYVFRWCGGYLDLFAR